MSATHDGGPAFPIPLAQTNDGGIRHANEYGNAGMSLHDYYVGKVLQGLCANPGGPFQANAMCGWDLTNCTMEGVIVTARKLADEAIKARSA